MLTESCKVESFPHWSYLMGWSRGNVIFDHNEKGWTYSKHLGEMIMYIILKVWDIELKFSCFVPLSQPVANRINGQPHRGQPFQLPTKRYVVYKAFDSWFILDHINYLKTFYCLMFYYHLATNKI